MSLNYRFAQAVLADVGRLGLMPAVRRGAAAAAAAAPEAPASVAVSREPEKKKSMWSNWGTHALPPPEREIPPMSPDFKEFPERDVVNFPHLGAQMWPSKTRFYIIPDSWFQLFYKKTGVTGPYFLGGGFLLFLIQKEITPIADQYKYAGSVVAMLFVLQKLFGKSLATAVNAPMYEEDDRVQAWQDEQTKGLKDAIHTENYLQECYQNVTSLIAESKRENVLLQLEASYRDRLNTAFSEVKRRMEYLVQVEETKRRFEQRHMVNWIVDQVKQSITPEAEKVYLAKCIADLKGLAPK